MADVTESPVSSPARRSAASGAARSARTQESLEDQVAQLQSDIKAIGATLARLSDQKVSDARTNARNQYSTLVRSGQSMVDELSEQVNAYEGQLVEAIREKPLTAVASAIGIGFLIALLSRR